MIYAEAVKEITRLLSAQKMAEAAAAIHEAYSIYGESAGYLVYADQSVDRMVEQYETLGEWKRSAATYEDALLRVRDSDGEPYQGTALALHYLSSIKRYLGLNLEAIELLEELRTLETRKRTLLQYSIESAWGALLVECYKDTGNSAAAQLVFEDYMAQSKNAPRVIRR